MSKGMKGMGCNWNISKQIQMPYCHGAILFCHILAKFVNVS
jgi:hypothetical protein